MKPTRRTSILSALAGTGLFLAVTGCTADADPQMVGEQGAVSLATEGSDQVGAEDARPGHR